MPKDQGFNHAPELSDALALTREIAESHGLSEAYAFELYSLERRIDEALAWRQSTAARAALREAERLRCEIERRAAPAAR